MGGEVVAAGAGVEGAGATLGAQADRRIRDKTIIVRNRLFFMALTPPGYELLIIN